APALPLLETAAHRRNRSLHGQPAKRAGGGDRAIPRPRIRGPVLAARFAGASVGWLAPHVLDVRRDINRRVVGLISRLAIPRRSPLRGAPRRAARASPPRCSAVYH